MEDITKEEREVLLIEYQAAQSSAQFHSGLIWSVTNLLWAAALLLFGFIITQLEQNSHPILLTLISTLGILLIIFSWICSLQFNSITNQKYQRCKDIEFVLGMKQHTKLKYKKYSQRLIYGVIIKLFIFCWLTLIACIWLP